MTRTSQLPSFRITLDKHQGVFVLRDDLLVGGTKRRFIVQLIPPGKHTLVYASPAYGGFQIALAATCKQIGKQAVIFVAKRNNPHPNTLQAKALGARIMQVEHGYLTHVEYQAARFALADPGAYKIKFGAEYPEAISAIAKTMQEVTRALHTEPDHIWCAWGSGTLARGILAGTHSAQVHAVQVGRQSSFTHPRLTSYRYPRPFDYITSYPVPFPSCGNYDAKAWQIMRQHLSTEGLTLFWNVLA